MRAALAAVLLLVGLLPPHASRAREAPGPTRADQEAIAGVITGQIAAFRHDDAAAAFGYAAPSIQYAFGNPVVFLQMVRRDYAAVYRPRSVRMRDLLARDGQVVQRVELVGPDGQSSLALYSMEHEPDGSWRIAGCTLAMPDGQPT